MFLVLFFLCVLLRTNTNPNDTKANAAGRRGVRVRSAKGMCENQGAWAAKCLIKREALVGGVHSGNAHRKAPDLRNTEFHYSRGQTDKRSVCATIHYGLLCVLCAPFVRPILGTFV